MKIANAISDYTKVENLYQNSDRVTNQPVAENKSAKTTIENNPQQTIAPTVATREILTQNELQTLAVLFGTRPESEFTFYGRNQVHQSFAGHLLDIKG